MFKAICCACSSFSAASKVDEAPRQLQSLKSGWAATVANSSVTECTVPIMHLVRGFRRLRRVP
jgi:hypothetical protein